MGRFRLLALLSVVLSASSCAFLLDFDELQKGGAGGADAGPDGGAAGMSAGSGGQAGSSAGATAGGEGGAAGAAGVPLDQAASVVADALCTKLDECFGSAALELVFFDEECQTVETSVLENTTVANVTLSEQNGTLDYDPSALPGCIDAVATLDCEALSVSFPEECKQALGGLQQEGKACEHSLECEAGLYCNTQVCPGTCSKPLAADAPCTELDTCAPGLTCFQSACAALGKEGEA
ncbi:MAG TPA: hypothetical protein VGP93_04615, partial [Polyangiaceae bacterium]|nr:hypothetical protein [Polyangiaceae bacterium]